MPLELTFPKSGAEIGETIGRRLEKLQTRLVLYGFEAGLEVD